MSADAVFGALSDPTRRRLLTLLDEHPEASATELVRELPVSRQAVVKHPVSYTHLTLPTTPYV